jgi:hypothetical protein
VTRDADILALASELAALRKAARRGVSQPRLGNSSMEGGSVPVYLPGTRGTVVGTVFGRQYDGTYGAIALSGPTPPVPSGLTAERVLGGILVHWNGEFEQTPEDLQAGRPTVAPLGFSHCEVHVSPSFLTLTGLVADTLQGSGIRSARGGSQFVPWTPGVPLYVRLTCRVVSGKVSAPGIIFGPVESGPVGLGDLGFDLADYAGGTTVFAGADLPEDPTIGDLWLKEVGVRLGDAAPLYETRRWDGIEWKLQEAQGITQALADALSAQLAADSKAHVFPQISPPTGLGPDDIGDVWIDLDDENRQYTWDGDEWVPRLLGNAAIRPGSLIASNVIATGTITAALFEAIMVITTTLIAGDVDGEHVRVDSTGVAAYANDPVDGLPNEIARLGRTLGIRDPDTGEIRTLIDAIGGVSTNRLSVESDPVIMGRTLTSLLAERAQTGYAWGNVNGNSARSTGAELGFVDITETLQNGRQYKLHTSHMRMNGSVDGQVGQVNIRFTTAAGNAAPPVPTISSTFLTRIVVPVPYGVGSQVASMVCLFDTPPGDGETTYRFLLSHNLVQGTGDVYIAQSEADKVQMWFEDMGPSRLQSFVGNNGGGAATGGTGGTPVVSKQRYTRQFENAWFRTFRGNGTFRTDTPDPFQGYGDSYNGNQVSMIGWNDWTGWLTGATIERVEIYLYAAKWWFHSGGTAIIGVHANLSPPNSLVNTAANLIQVGGWKNAEAKWVELPAQYIDGFRTGAYRGILLGPGPSNDNQYYGRFAGGNNTLMRITYVK